MGKKQEVFHAHDCLKNLFLIRQLLSIANDPDLYITALLSNATYCHRQRLIGHQLLANGPRKLSIFDRA